MPIAVENLTYLYPSAMGEPVGALREVTVAIPDGEFVGVMGHTGCGKTTLLQMLAGLLVPGSGRVLLDGSDINAPRFDKALLRRSVGLVFQYPEYQLFETTVEKDVAFGLKHLGLSKAQCVERVRWALETMGFAFDGIREQSPLALSGGEKRRVAIAGVLAAKPRFLMFDEPVAGLDPLGREDFLHLVKRLNAEGTTIVMVSHNADAIAACAKRLLVLENGSLVLDDTPQAIFADVQKMNVLRLGVSASRRIAALLEQKGVALPQGIITYDALLDALKHTMKGDRPR